MGRTTQAVNFLQPERPTVYLDQWVWIRLSRALTGRPREKFDARLLDTLLGASEAGVAFPLSTIHYIETSAIKDPAQRLALAEVMGRISHFRTLRYRRALLREQLLMAMHKHFGRPMFRPAISDPLGLGVHWAFLGKESMMRTYSTETGAPIASDAVTNEILCRWNQWTQIHLLAGPSDGEVPRLRERYGYKPETTHEMGKDRLEFERYFEQMIRDDPVTEAEMRLRVQAREVVHENLDLIVEVFQEFAIPIRKLTGGFESDPVRSREFIIGFFDSMPSVRVAVDAKVGVYWDREKSWAQGDIYDADAMTIAVPYSHIVVVDGAAADALIRRKTGNRTGTLVTKKLDDLMDAIPDLEQRARQLPDPSGWDRVCRGVGYRPEGPQAGDGSIGMSCAPPTRD